MGYSGLGGAMSTMRTRMETFHALEWCGLYTWRHLAHRRRASAGDAGNFADVPRAPDTPGCRHGGGATRNAKKNAGPALAGERGVPGTARDATRCAYHWASSILIGTAGAVGRMAGARAPCAQWRRRCERARPLQRRGW